MRSRVRELVHRSVLVCVLLCVASAAATASTVDALTIDSYTAVLITTFNGDDPELADQAYRSLYALQDRAITALLRNVEAETPYAGDAWRNPYSSILILSPAAGLVSLYLVEGILAGSLTPHLLPRLVCVEMENPEDAFNVAKALYLDWWAEHGGLSMCELRAAQHPLTGSGIVWF